MRNELLPYFKYCLTGSGEIRYRKSPQTSNFEFRRSRYSETHTLLKGIGHPMTYLRKTREEAQV